MKTLASTISLLCLIALILVPSVSALTPAPGIKFRDFDPTVSELPPDPSSPPGSSRIPPGGDTTTGVCTAGGPGVVVSALFTYYRRQGMSVTEAQARAEQRVLEYTDAGYRVFAGQPCIDTVVKALVRVALIRGVDYYDLLNQVSTLSTSEIIALFPKESSTPLFLWSPEPVSVLIRVQGLVTQSLPSIRGNFWEVLIGPDSQLTETKTGQVYPAIDYTLRLENLPPLPDNRLYINSSKLENILQTITEKAGLPEEYRASTLQSWQSHIPQAPAYEIGMYSPETSEKILPLTFSPMPATIHRLVLFVKPLLALPREIDDDSRVEIPDVSQRLGFTALDVGLVIGW